MKIFFKSIYNEALILQESKSLASRHLTFKEKIEIVSKIKDACKNGTLDIVKRDKNLNFLKKVNFNKEKVLMLIEEMIRPENVICVVNDRDRRDQELYIISLFVEHQWIYLKIRTDCKTIVSFHDLNEKIYPDYRAIKGSEYDSSFVDIVAKDWFKNFNKNKKAKLYKLFIIDYYQTGDDIEFSFNKNFEPKSETLYQIIDILAKSCPKDKGLSIKEIPIKFDGKNAKIIVTIPI